MAVLAPPRRLARVWRYQKLLHHERFDLPGPRRSPSRSHGEKNKTDLDGPIHDAVTHQALFSVMP